MNEVPLYQTTPHTRAGRSWSTQALIYQANGSNAKPMAPTRAKSSDRHASRRGRRVRLCLGTPLSKPEAISAPILTGVPRS